MLDDGMLSSLSIPDNLKSNIKERVTLGWCKGEHVHKALVNGWL